jgi:hypothetical protein
MVRSRIWEHMLKRAHKSQDEAMIVCEEIERFVITKFNGRQVSLSRRTFGDL